MYFWEKLIFVGVFLALGGIVALGVIAFLNDRDAIKIELIKADWNCTQTRESVVLIPQIIGKVTIQQPHFLSQCVQYTVKG